MKNEVLKILSKFNCPENILERYDEPHRFYHTWDNHIEPMLQYAKNGEFFHEDLLLAIVFHDIIYDPTRDDNEFQSAELYKQFTGRGEDLIYKAIIETKTHKPTFDLSIILTQLDLAIIDSTFTNFVNFEKNIFKEYQFLDYSKYKIGRIKVLEELGASKNKIEYVKNRDIKIGVYTGSFSPFHIGHYDVLSQAEKIFDKVIIARGINPEKCFELRPLPKSIMNRQIIEYDGLLTDMINGLNYDVTLIRGIRNASDLEFEKIQLQYMRELKPDLKIVTFLSDPKHEHISSSALKSLEKFSSIDKYIIK